MLTIYRDFERFIGDDRKKLRVSIFLNLLENILGLAKLYGIYIVLKAILENRLTSGVIWQSFLVMLTALAIASFLKARSSIQQTEIGYGTAARKRLEIGEHLKYVPMGYFNANSLGRITSIATNTCAMIHEISTIVIMQVASGLLDGLVITVMLFFFRWELGLVALAAMTSFFLLYRLMSSSAESLSQTKLDCDARLVEKTLEYLRGMQVVKSFNLGNGSQTRLLDEIESNKKINTRLELVLIHYMFLISLVLRLLAVLIIYLSLKFCFDGSMPLAETMMMLIISYLLFQRIELAANFSSLLKLLRMGMDTINSVQQIPVMDENGRDITPATRDIDFEHVDFAYEKQNVLNDINLHIPERSMTAIVGPSGSGKTTLTYLIERFWDPTSGRVMLGGHDLRAYTLDSLWENITQVFQNVYLFNDTVANNIRFGVPDAPLEAVIDAAKRANCHDFILGLENGYDTIIGEGGSTLSGGEAQRISIARAMMKDAPIVILDEATANVDPENEKLLVDAIEELTRQKTVIMIAHRLKTVRNADRIVVINGGRIEAVGTHDELMARGGTYRDFVERREKTIGWKIGA